MKDLTFRNLLFSVIAIFILNACVWSQSANAQESMADLIDRSFVHAEKQALLMAEELDTLEGLLPRSIDKYGNLVTSEPAWWTSGFYPGVLWYLYENSGNKQVKAYARKYTQRVESSKYHTANHDVGFMIGCSFGNAYRLLAEETDKDVLITAGTTLIKRYDPKVGAIRSWSWNKDKWKYPVIIDNMMNLELLSQVYKHTKDSLFYDIIVSHADKTMEDHFREDYSCYHVVSYDPETGLPHIKQTHQGYSASSSWARGQGWAVYAYTMMYRETGLKRYLDHARRVADFIINHPSLPEDKIPYWDFDAPDQPNSYRDASAGAIIASALVELSQYVDAKEGEEYLKVAEMQIRTLASDNYMAPIGTHGNFILKHSVGGLPFDSEVDKPLTYADYYFLEAMLRYRKVKTDE